MQILWALGLAWALHSILLNLQGSLPGWLPALEVLGALALVLWLDAGRTRRLHQSNEKVVDLHQYRKEKSKEQKPLPQWVPVFKSTDAAEVGLLTSLLDSKGIETQVANRHASALLPQVGALPMEVLVRPVQLAAAQKVTEEFNGNLPEA